MGAQVRAAGGPQLQHLLYRALHFDGSTGAIGRQSPLSTRPWSEIVALSQELLTQHAPGSGIAEQVPTWSKAQLTHTWQTPLLDVHALFRTLRSQGRRIAMLTADARAPTMAVLEREQLLPMLDAVVCGDDGLAPKPQAEPALAICRRVGVEPIRACIVGDTPADMGLKASAGLGLSVGVLSGIGGELELAAADCLLPSVDALGSLLRHQPVRTVSRARRSGPAVAAAA